MKYGHNLDTLQTVNYVQSWRTSLLHMQSLQIPEAPFMINIGLYIDVGSFSIHGLPESNA